MILAMMISYSALYPAMHSASILLRFFSLSASLTTASTRPRLSTAQNPSNTPLKEDGLENPVFRPLVVKKTGHVSNRDSPETELRGNRYVKDALETSNSAEVNDKEAIVSYEEGAHLEISSLSTVMNDRESKIAHPVNSATETREFPAMSQQNGDNTNATINQSRQPRTHRTKRSRYGKTNHTQDDYEQLGSNHTHSDDTRLKANQSRGNSQQFQPNHTQHDKEDLTSDHTHSGNTRRQHKPNQLSGNKQLQTGRITKDNEELQARNNSQLEPDKPYSVNQQPSLNQTNSGYTQPKSNQSYSANQQPKLNHTYSAHKQLNPNQTDSDYIHLKLNQTNSANRKLKSNQTYSADQRLNLNQAYSANEQLKPYQPSSANEQVKSNQSFNAHQPPKTYATRSNSAQHQSNNTHSNDKTLSPDHKSTNDEDVSFDDTTDVSFDDTTDVSFDDTTDVSFDDTTDVSFDDTNDVSFDDTNDVSFDNTNDVSFDNTNDVSFDDTNDVSFEDINDVSFDDTNDDSLGSWFNFDDSDDYDNWSDDYDNDDYDNWSENYNWLDDYIERSSTSDDTATEETADVSSKNFSDTESINWNTDDMVDCFTKNKPQAAGIWGLFDDMNWFLVDGEDKVYRETFSREGQVSMHFNLSHSTKARAMPSTNPRGGSLKYTCMTKHRAPKGQVLTLTFDEMKSDGEFGNKVDLYTCQRVAYNGLSLYNAYSLSMLLVWDSDCLVLKISVRAEELFGLKFRLRAIPASQPEVITKSSTEGVIQTPFYNGQTVFLKDMVKPWAEITVPADHVVMVSFPWTEVFGNLTLTTDTSERSYACREFPMATVYRTTTLRVRYVKHCKGAVYDIADKELGFRVNFTFHPLSAVPEQLGDGTFNCSVPHWPQFQHHLLCNLQWECEGGEDEVPCPYHTPRCGPGYVAVGKACLFYLGKLDRPISWLDASDLCEDRGGRLATLKTDQDVLRAVATFQLHNFRNVPFYVGVGRVTNVPYAWYKTAFRWSDGTVVHNGAPTPGIPFDADEYAFPDVGGEEFCVKAKGTPDFCGNFIRFEKVTLLSCDAVLPAAAICEKAELRLPLPRDSGTLTWPPLRNRTFRVPVVTCQQGQMAHDFLACDVSTDCWSRDDASPCAAPLTPLPPAFACGNGMGEVPYTLVCDHKADCLDSSDEFCDFPRCPPRFYSCGDTQCIPRDKVCDGWHDCLASCRQDEQGCWGTKGKCEWWKQWTYLPAPNMVNVNARADFYDSEIPEGPDGVKACPDTHFRCRDEGNCLPLFFRCNGVLDCMYHEDEADCESFTCPGFYRCRGSAVCLHPEHVCDGLPHCPQSDDELLCELRCPAGCVCRGLAFFCTRWFPVQRYDGLRYLDATGTTLSLADTKGISILVFLRLAKCGLTSLHGLALPNLLYLDLSHNNLTSLSAAAFDGVPRVHWVVLSGNVFLELLDSGGAQHGGLSELDLSGVHVPRLNATVLSAFPALHSLNLSGSGIQRVVEGGLQPLSKLRVVDLRGSAVSHVPPLMFQGLRSLQAVYADSFRLCCPALLPADFNLHDCHAPFDEVSSCGDLLGSELYSAVTFCIALVAVMGNCCSFVYRVFVSKAKSRLGFGVFVTHLSLSDFLMGVYLVMLGAADQVYKGRYLWSDVQWRDSPACAVAGFLSLLSSEVSALIMCLITLDRFLVLRFPFSSCHFTVRSAHLASCLAWLLGVVMAAVPLLPVTSHWRFYGHSSTCLPLPVTRKDFAGRNYSFGVVIVLNFVLFLFVCCGQLVIYWSVQANAMSAAVTSSSTRKTQELTIARRLLAVAMSDFLAWFPIGLLGLLAARGVPIPGEVNVAMAVLVLPLNSALNPFLYTVNVLLERRRLASEERLRKFIMSQLTAKPKGGE